jgi:cobalt-zinc-cadmium efflux system membrane fusion protein
MKTIVLISILVIATLASCNSANNRSAEENEQEEHGVEGVVILNENQREALDLKLGHFQMRNLTTVVKTNGQLEVPPSSKADITAIIGGNVKSILVFHGDKVKKGQTLAILEHPDYISLQEDYSVSASRLEFLEQEFERQTELYENNVGSGKEYQQVKSEYNMEKARLEGLKSRLKLLKISPEKVREGIISNTIQIVSPINGYISDVNIKVGTYVDARDKMFEVNDNSAIHADFLVYENDVHRVQDGQTIHFTVSNKPDMELSATVFAIGKEFEPNTRAVHIHASINEQFSGLIPGMYISGHLHTDENYTQALPDNAVVTEGTKSFIFVLDQKVLIEFKEENEENENNGEENGEEYEEAIEIGEDAMAFRMIEVVTGQKDDGYTEVKLLDSLPENIQIVMNAAYYLLSDLKKDEAGDDD